MCDESVVTACDGAPLAGRCRPAIPGKRSVRLFTGLKSRNSQLLIPPNRYGTSYRYSSSQRGPKVKALRFGRIPDISRGLRRWVWRRCRRRSRSPVFFTIVLALLHRLLLSGDQQAKHESCGAFRHNRVNLRTKRLPRRCRILVEQRLNPVVVLLKQRRNLLLFRSRLQIFRKASKFLVDRCGLRIC
jgi:hypothetical protein